MEDAGQHDLVALLNKKEKISFDLAILYTIQLLDALSYIHRRKIAHLDVSPENVIVNNSSKKVVLIDFGLCRTAVESGKSFPARSGKKSYQAPEIMSQRFPENYDCRFSDIFSAGICAFLLICRYSPWRSARKHEDPRWSEFAKAGTFRVFPEYQKMLSCIFHY